MLKARHADGRPRLTAQHAGQVHTVSAPRPVRKPSVLQHGTVTLDVQTMMTPCLSAQQRTSATLTSLPLPQQNGHASKPSPVPTLQTSAVTGLAAAQLEVRVHCVGTAVQTPWRMAVSLPLYSQHNIVLCHGADG
jgi:hypothetical protein